MRRLFNIWAVILCALAVVGCEKAPVDDNPDTGGQDHPTPGATPEITLEQKALDFSSFTFEVKTNVEASSLITLSIITISV